MAARRLALLVLSDRPEERWARITRATRRAAAAGARWLLTPELAVPGYTFAHTRGLGWLDAPDPELAAYRTLLAELELVAFLGTAIRDGTARHNTVLALDRGALAGRQDKVLVLPGRTEGWATPGAPQVVLVDGVRVGLLICADAWKAEGVQALVAQGAEVLLSAAHWTPGFHGPEGTWEARSAESGLPLVVCNCAGADTVVALGGQRVLSVRPAEDTLVYVSLGAGGWADGGAEPLA